ncbi:MAG: CDP-glycerol glycerophosphotransferase family protein [Clostridiales bacterium]|nr:CDP-glycerol glycerophosphotransferase family protein [Clostridiales bacterium]
MTGKGNDGSIYVLVLEFRGNKMIDTIKTYLAMILRILLRVFRVGKFHKKRVLFFSFFGTKYSCNPVFISDYLRKNYPDFEIAWAFVDPDKYRALAEKGIKLVKYNSIEFLHILLTSRFIITNSEIPSWYPITKKQVYINTWHGGGNLKRVGAAYEKETKGKQLRGEIARKNDCIYISSSDTFTQTTLRDSFHSTGEVLSCGMPRNDILFKTGNKDFERKVREKLGIPEGNKVLLYAPTYREAKDAGEYVFDCKSVKEALSQRFGGEWTVLYRMHYFVMNTLEKSTEYIDATSLEDMQQILYISDVLITDYSSSMWDFGLTGRPCLVYATDLDYYEKNRGLYVDIHTLPFPVSENNEELIKTIRSFDADKYRVDLEAYYKELGSYEQGNATEYVCNYLVSRVDK